MNRNAVVPVAMAFFLTVVAIAAVPGPVGALPAGGSAAGAQDDPDEAPALVVVGDFNRDGVPDVARVTSAAGDLSGPHVLTVLLGHANGGFRQAASIPMPGHDPRSMVVGDFNGDGIPDLIVGDGDGSLIEFLGDGTGNMVPAGNVAHLGSIASIAVGDFNHDGILDIAVSDANLVTVLLGSGKGSFRAIWATPLPMQGAVSTETACPTWPSPTKTRTPSRCCSATATAP
jgi:hypothetical protein